MYKYDIILKEDQPQFDILGNLINNPFANLKDKINLPFYHAFITEDLIPDERFEDLRFFYLYFHGEKNQREAKKTIHEKPTWDSVYKAEILRSFTSRHSCWQISVFGFLWDGHHDCNYQLQVELENDIGFVFNKGNNFKLTEFRNNNENFRFRRVFCIDNHLIEMIVMKYFQKADNQWPNQGYLTHDNDEMALYQLDLWDRDIDLFFRFLERCPVSFFSFPDTNEHLCFITNQYTLPEFKEKIGFDQMRNEIRKLA